MLDDSKQKIKLFRTQQEMNQNLQQTKVLKKKEVEKLNDDILDLKEQLGKLEAETQPDIFKNMKQITKQKKFNIELNRLKEQQAPGKTDEAISRLIVPYLQGLDVDINDWLKDNGYAPIYPIDMKKVLLEKEELNHQNDLIEKEKKLDGEIEGSKQKCKDVKVKIREYQEQQERIRAHNAVLQQNQLDLNDLEQQMIETLNDEGIPLEDFVSAVLYKKEKQVNFEKVFSGTA